MRNARRHRHASAPVPGVTETKRDLGGLARTGKDAWRVGTAKVQSRARARDAPVLCSRVLNEVKFQNSKRKQLVAPYKIQSISTIRARHKFSFFGSSANGDWHWRVCRRRSREIRDPSEFVVAGVKKERKKNTDRSARA
jgi:hypothetical protein